VDHGFLSEGEYGEIGEIPPHAVSPDINTNDDMDIRKGA
jgi:hypothetical protein